MSFNSNFNTENDILPPNFMVNLSDNRRKTVSKLRDSRTSVVKSRSNWSFLFYDTLPALIASSVVYPLYNARVLLQTDVLRKDKLSLTLLSTFSCKLIFNII